MKPLRYSKMAFVHCTTNEMLGKCVFPVFVELLKHIQMAVTRYILKGARRAAFSSIVVKPNDDIQVSISRRFIHGFGRAAFSPILMKPLNNGQTVAPAALSIAARVHG